MASNAHAKQASAILWPPLAQLLAVFHHLVAAWPLHTYTDAGSGSRSGSSSNMNNGNLVAVERGIIIPHSTC